MSLELIAQSHRISLQSVYRYLEEYEREEKTGHGQRGGGCSNKLYPNNLKHWDLGRVKALGFSDLNQPNITNIEQVETVQPRELSRRFKTNSSGYLGINDAATQ